MVIHCYCERLVRCTDGSNHQHLIVVIICERAREAGTQYTKRMLPWFVIPECNIRLDLVLELWKKHPTAGSARAHAYAVIGSACERTIARHLLWVDDTCESAGKVTPGRRSKGPPSLGLRVTLYSRASFESS